MSEFTFSKDRAGTTTVVHDTPGGSETKNGTAELSFKDCPIKKLLGFMRAHSDVEVCGDVDISSSDADVFVKGKAGKRLVKELGLVYGALTTNDDGSVTFTELDPDDKNVDDLNVDGSDEDLTENMHDGMGHDSMNLPNEDGSPHQVINLESPDDSIEVSDADKKWFLRVLRADGEAQYIEVQPINDIVNGVQASNSVTSILATMTEMGALMGAVRQVASESYRATEDDAQRLEDALDSDIRKLHNHLVSLEANLKAFIEQSDSDTWDHISGQLKRVTDAIGNNQQHFALNGIEDLTVNEECSSSAIATTFTSEEPIEAYLQDIKKWMVQVSVVETTQQDDGEGGTVSVISKLRHDIDLIASVSIADDGKLQVVTSPVQCDALGFAAKVKVTALWCGSVEDLPDTEEITLPDYTPSPLSGTKDRDSEGTGGLPTTVFSGAESDVAGAGDEEDSSGYGHDHDGYDDYTPPAETAAQMFVRLSSLQQPEFRFTDPQADDGFGSANRQGEIDFSKLDINLDQPVDGLFAAGDKKFAVGTDPEDLSAEAIMAISGGWLNLHWFDADDAEQSMQVQVVSQDGGIVVINDGQEFPMGEWSQLDELLADGAQVSLILTAQNQAEMFAEMLSASSDTGYTMPDGTSYKGAYILMSSGELPSEFEYINTGSMIEIMRRWDDASSSYVSVTGDGKILVEAYGVTLTDAELDALPGGAYKKFIEPTYYDDGGYTDGGYDYYGGYTDGGTTYE